MPSGWIVRTGRLVLRPVSGADLADLQRLKADPRVFAVMLGGIRTPLRTAEELAEDVRLWGRRGVGMWSVREAASERFVGIAGVMERTDGRGMALRFALDPESQGRGYASEAAGAALRFAHDEGGLARVVAVAREDNVGSRTVLGAIGMREEERFIRDATPMVMFASERPPAR